MKLQKFENVDAAASLAIMKQNTAFYQSDFDIDKQIFAESGGKPYPGGQTVFVVFPPVRDVLLPGTGRFSKGHKGSIIHGGFTGTDPRYYPLAYAVERQAQSRKNRRNLYELDYLQHFRK